MEEKNETIQEKIIELMKNHYITISTSLMVLLLIGLFQPVTIRYSTFIFFTHLILFLIGKDIIDDKPKKIGNIYFKSSIFIYIYSFLAIMLRGMSKRITTNKSLLPLGLMMGIGVTMFLVFVFLDEDKREIIDRIVETPYAKKLGLIKIGDMIKPGDMKLCLNKQTKEPVILPHKDRYVHMLVLGPTGSGKTSQVLTPSILNDFQNPDIGMTIIEPKGDLAEQIYAMGEIYDREVIYFNPTEPDCPYFNPLYGPEAEVIENITSVYGMLSGGDQGNPFFQNKAENLTRNAIMLLKRLKGNRATLLDFSNLIHDANGQGVSMVREFQAIKPDTVEIAKQNEELASWFLDEYFNDKTKEFEHCSGIRSQVAKTVSNKYLRKVLNPPGDRNDLNFDKILEEGKVLAISTAQGALRDLSSYLGYFIILNYQSAVFRRPGNEDTRRPHFLYIDEFQTYSNPFFGDMLTQGRSYRVGCILATQARDQMAMGSGSDGEKFVQLVSSNARNTVLFPGISAKDAEYYSRELGEKEEVQTSKSLSKETFSLFGGSGKAPTESVSERVELIPNYTPSEIRYKPFKEITYSLVNNNELQPPGDGIVEFIPVEIYKEINRLVAERTEEQKRKAEELEMSKKINYDDGPVADPLGGQNEIKDPIKESMQEENKTPIDNFEYKDNFVGDVDYAVEDDLI